jgi:hypothetical protein
MIDLHSKENFNPEMFLSLLLGVMKYLYLPIYIGQLGNVRVSYGRNSAGALAAQSL